MYSWWRRRTAAAGDVWRQHTIHNTRHITCCLYYSYSGWLIMWSRIHKKPKEESPIIWIKSRYLENSRAVSLPTLWMVSPGHPTLSLLLSLCPCIQIISEPGRWCDRYSQLMGFQYNQMSPRRHSREEMKKIKDGTVTDVMCIWYDSDMTVSATNITMSHCAGARACGNHVLL